MLEEYSKELNLCNTCPSLCQSACPVFVNDGNRSHSPWGILQALSQVRHKKMFYSPDVAELAYHCLDCTACSEQCEHDVPVVEILQTARHIAYKHSNSPKTILEYVEAFHRQNNPYNKDLLHKLQTLLPERHFKKDATVAYYSSCTTICKTPEVIKDTFELFDKLKIDFVTVFADPIQCCGYPLYSSGAESDFIDIAEINFHSLLKYKTIIVGSPQCAHTLKEIYASYDFDLKIQILTINEFLKPYLKNINYKLKKNIRHKLMYHDPCFAARELHEMDLPREMIANISGYPPIEFYDNRNKTMCAGQGGPYNLICADKADEITQKRLAECHEKKINMVITQCPTCLHKMRANGNKLIIKDIISYLNDTIEGVET